MAIQTPRSAALANEGQTFQGGPFPLKHPLIFRATQRIEQPQGAIRERIVGPV
jgi:hypothetical protein